MKKIILLSALILSIGATNAQQQKNIDWDMSEGALLDGKTIVKANALGWAFRNFGFYGERIINKNISAVVGINFMPKGGIPYISSFTKDPMSRNIRTSSFAFTPEVRFYLSKSGYGQGFYIAPYYKYERLSADNMTYTIDKNKAGAGEDVSVAMKGNLNTHGFGAIVGIQWLLGENKNIALDWTILGAHYGLGKADLNGNSSKAFSADEQAEIKKEIEAGLSGKPFIKDKTVTVDANSASVKMNGPWAFIRMALSIGYRF